MKSSNLYRIFISYVCAVASVVVYFLGFVAASGRPPNSFWPVLLIAIAVGAIAWIKHDVLMRWLTK